MSDDLYTLDSLSETIEKIKNEGEGPLNFPKAIYCLINEIKRLEERIEFHYDNFHADEF